MSTLMTNERLLRFLEDGNIHEALDQPLQVPKTRKEAMKDHLRGAATEDNAITTLTLGTFLYHYLRVNPLVVEGIDFARKEQFHNLFEFSHFAGKHVRAGVLNSPGAMENLKGFVAERFAAWDLQAAGHDVVFPGTSNNPGWDILVDGRRFQIKCVTEPSSVWKHLRTYPKIPVIVNAEMGETFKDVPNVYVLPSLKNGNIRKATADTLEHGFGLTRFQIPWVSMMVTSASALTRMVQHKTDLAAAFTTVVIDSGSRSFMGLVGRHAAACAGSLFFGPAGWVIGQQLGQVTGARLGKPIAEKVKRLLVAEEEAEVFRSVSGVLSSAAAEADPKIAVKAQQEEILRSSMLPTKANDHVMGRVAEHFQDGTRYEQNKKQEMLSYSKDPKMYFKTAAKAVEETCIITTQAGVHPAAVQSEWKDVSNSLASLEKAQGRFGIK